VLGRTTSTPQTAGCGSADSLGATARARAAPKRHQPQRSRAGVIRDPLIERPARTRRSTAKTLSVENCSARHPPRQDEDRLGRRLERSIDSITARASHGATIAADEPGPGAAADGAEPQELCLVHFSASTNAGWAMDRQASQSCSGAVWPPINSISAKYPLRIEPILRPQRTRRMGWPTPRLSREPWAGVGDQPHWRCHE